VLPSLSGVAPQTPSGVHSAPEIAKAYNFPTDYDGRGVTIGLIELGGALDQDDLTKYFSKIKLPVPNITTVLVDDAKAKPDPDLDGELMMDVEIMGALAPAASIRVYLAPPEGYVRAIEQATSDGVSVLQFGWGKPESLFKVDELQELDTALESAARKNITVLASVGNSGVTDGVDDKRRHVDFPGSSPWVLSVGGTALKTEGGKIASEKVWKTTGPFTASTGGGFSEKFSRPNWQPVGLFPRGIDASSGRGVPDVVASADPNLGTPIIIHGKEMSIGGTSVAVNIWAGLIARIDQALGHNVGYLTPRLYEDIGPAHLLHTIAGDNSINSVPGYSAGDQWSPVAGWGSPDGMKLLTWLREHPDAGVPPSIVARPCQTTVN
jgi:kumamolisin